MKCRVASISASAPVLVEGALGAHAAHDPAAADRDVRVLVGDQDGGADPLVAAAGRVGAVDAGDHRHAAFLELGMTEEGRAVASAVRVDLFLLRQLHAAAVHDPDERHAEPSWPCR